LRQGLPKGAFTCEGDCRDQEDDGGASGVIHTPYDGTHKPFSIGLQQLDLATWIDVDRHRDFYLADKNRLYADETANVLVAEEGTEEAQREVADLLSAHLQSHYPNLYAKDQEKLGPRFRGDDGKGWSGDDGLGALARAALNIQEDLVLMRKSIEGWRLVAASLCFPSAWNLREKFGKTLARVHEPVPGFGEGTRNASLIERMFDNLWPERPVMRWNWTLFGKTQLYHPVSERGEKRRFGDGALADTVTIRMERQTLRKLPKSGDILFTIRTYLDPIETLQTHVDGNMLVQAIVDQVRAYSPDEIAYKGLTQDMPRLLARLEQVRRNHRG
jgi:dimethylamine monooxygenase subunit A